MSKMDTVGAVFLLRDDGAALLQHRDEKPGLRHAGAWVPPGGHCDCGEAVEACARRELCEETDYICDKLFHLTSIIDGVPEWPPYRLVVFWGVYDGVQRVHCREGQGIEFIKRRHIHQYAMPQYLVEFWDSALEAYAIRGAAGI
jgi:ADP-ribose pyrophosphatase YjhB (NUDIX family)